MESHSISILIISCLPFDKWSDSRKNNKNMTLYCIFTFVQQVSGKGLFQLRLLSFTNELALDINGNCCDGSPYRTDRQCSTLCRTYFKICLFNFVQHIDTEPFPKCTYGNSTTKILGNNTFEIPTNDSEGLIQLPFDYAWPVSPVLFPTQLIISGTENSTCVILHFGITVVFTILHNNVQNLSFSLLLMIITMTNMISHTSCKNSNSVAFLKRGHIGT